MPSTSAEQLDALPVGAVLHEFSIQVVIGRDPFGIIYVAERNELDLTVAINGSLLVGLSTRKGVTRAGSERLATPTCYRARRNRANQPPSPPGRPLRSGGQR